MSHYDEYPLPPDHGQRPRARDPHDPVVLKPLEVRVADGKLDKALKKLKRKMAAEGILKELKRRRRAIKPSAQRRRKQVEAARRRRKREKAAEKRRAQGR